MCVIMTSQKYVTDVLIPEECPLASDFSAKNQQNMLLKVYGLAEAPVKSTIWE